MPKVSVIVPIYNNDKYLPKCIDSILSQTFTDFELLLIDDGSDDKSGLICDQYASIDARVRVFHKENGGVSSARNLGLESAMGEWVTFVDSDDWIEHSMYDKMLDKAIHENADIVYCDINMVYVNYEECWRATKCVTSKELFLNNFILSEWTSLCNVLIKKQLFLSNNITNPEGVPFCEDYHVIVRLMYFANKICHVPEPLYNYNRINESSAVHNYTPLYYSKGRWVNLDLIAFFKREGVYQSYAKSLSWRLLKYEQELVLNKNTYNEFLALNHDSFRYIWSCPYLNVKIKVMMWALSHHFRIIAEALLLIRNFRLKYFS